MREKLIDENFYKLHESNFFSFTVIIRTELQASQAYDIISVINKALWASLIMSRVCVSVYPTLPHFILVAPVLLEYSS